MIKIYLLQGIASAFAKSMADRGEYQGIASTVAKAMVDRKNSRECPLTFTPMDPDVHREGKPSPPRERELFLVITSSPHWGEERGEGYFVLNI